MRINLGQIKVNLKPNLTYNSNAPCVCLSRSKFHHQTSFVSKILSISTLWWESSISSLLTTLRWEFFFFCRISYLSNLKRDLVEGRKLACTTDETRLLVKSVCERAPKSFSWSPTCVPGFEFAP